MDIGFYLFVHGGLDGIILMAMPGRSSKNLNLRHSFEKVLYLQ